jgi:hypothetical protein
VRRREGAKGGGRGAKGQRGRKGRKRGGSGQKGGEGSEAHEGRGRGQSGGGGSSAYHDLLGAPADAEDREEGILAVVLPLAHDKLNARPRGRNHLGIGDVDSGTSTGGRKAAGLLALGLLDDRRDHGAHARACGRQEDRKVDAGALGHDALKAAGAYAQRAARPAALLALQLQAKANVVLIRALDRRRRYERKDEGGWLHWDGLMGLGSVQTVTKSAQLMAFSSRHRSSIGLFSFCF